MSDLKSCPFCGEKNEFGIRTETEGTYSWASIECNACSSRGPRNEICYDTFIFIDEINCLIKQWNALVSEK